MMKDTYVDDSLPKMNDYLGDFTEEELDAVADTVIAIIAFAYKYVKNEKNGPLIVEWHQVLWLAHIELHMWVLIKGPRGHGKSSIFTTWMLYKICTDPYYRFLIASHVEDLADEFSQRVMSYLEPVEDEPPIGEPYIPRDFDLAKGKKWTVGKAYFKGKKYPWVKTVAAKAGMTGGRFDAAVFDDPFTKLSIDSEKMRRKFQTWTNTSVIPALDETSRQKIVVIGTTKNLEDWYFHLQHNGQFACHIDQLYSYNEEDEKVYLWPAVPYPGEPKIKDHAFNEEREKKKRAMLSPSEFAMEFMNVAVAEEGLLFKYEWVEEHLYTDWEAEIPERYREVYMGIDPSLGYNTAKSSHFALAVIVYDNRPHKQDIYIVDLYRKKISLAVAEDVILAKAKEWNPRQINMEGDLVNREFASQMMTQLPRIRRVFYSRGGKTTGLKGSSDIGKIKRINQVFGMLAKNGKLRFKDPKLCWKTKEFFNYEYLQYPEGHLDLMDALNMAVDLVDFRKIANQSPVTWLY